MTLPLDAIFGGFDFGKLNAVAVALSGGSDSTALLFLLREYLKSLPTPPRLIAITIDHQLRSESGREAHEMSALCARIGVEHVTSAWSGPKPQSGVQAAARNARYALLSEAAARKGAGLVLTGHTLDDQIETVAMRMKRGAQLDNAGLAGIASGTLAFNDMHDGKPVWFARPLLHYRRAVLRSYLAGNGVGWFDDPSNANDKYERVALRQSTLDETALLRVQGEAMLRRFELSHSAAGLISRFAEEITPGLVFVSRAIADEPLAAEALTVLIAFAGGAGWMAERASGERAAQGLAAFGSGGRKTPLRFTASRALVDVRKTGVFLMREKRVLMETAKQVSFEGLYRKLGAAPHAGLRAPVSPVFADRVKSQNVPASLLAHARTTHPVLESALPVRRLINPWPDLVPVFDFEMARTLAEMTGLAELPPPLIHFDDKN